jgi:hypothetical protein
MSDVVDVALITGGFATASAGIGAFATYKVSARNATITVTTAEKHAEVELAKVEAENQRLRDQVREADRKSRADAYQEMLVAHTKLFSLSQRTPTKEETDQIIERVNAANAGVQLSTRNEGVIDALNSYAEIAGTTIAEGGNTENWTSAVVSHAQALRSAAANLADVMREDVALD